MRRVKQKNRIIDIICKNIINNIKEYTLITLIFVIGIFLGVFYFNSLDETKNEEVISYFNNYTNNLKETENLNIIELTKKNGLEKMLIGIILWFFGTTVIGIPVVFGIILYRGFCLGYTISTIISAKGILKGLIQAISLLFAHNLIFIPAIIAISVSGFKLYKSIIKDKKRDNIKFEIIRHTFFSAIMISFLCLSAIIEVVVSTKVFMIVS